MDAVALSRWLAFMRASEGSRPAAGRGFRGAVLTAPAAGATELLVRRAAEGAPGGAVLFACPSMTFSDVRRRLSAACGGRVHAVTGAAGLLALSETAGGAAVVLCTDRTYAAAARQMAAAGRPPALFLFDDADSTRSGRLLRGAPDPGAAVSWVVGRGARAPRLRGAPARPDCLVRLRPREEEAGGGVRVSLARDMRWRTPQGVRPLLARAAAALLSGEAVEVALRELPFSGGAPARVLKDATCPVCLEEGRAADPGLVAGCCGKRFCLGCGLAVLRAPAPGFPRCPWCRAPGLRAEGVCLVGGLLPGGAAPELEVEDAVLAELRAARRGKVVLVVDEEDDGFLFNCVPPGMPCVQLRGNSGQVGRALRAFSSLDEGVLVVREGRGRGCGLRLPEHSSVIIAARDADPVHWGCRGPRRGGAAPAVTLLRCGG